MSKKCAIAHACLKKARAHISERGSAVVAAAMHLKARGMVLADASQEQLLDALPAVSS